MQQFKIENIISEGNKYGYDISIRDVAYGLLRTVLDNALMCYVVVFGQPKNDSDIEVYEQLEKVKYLFRHFDKLLTPKEREKSSEEILASIKARQPQREESEMGNITFEENKAAMVELIQRTEDALNEGKIDPDKGLKIIADLRVKLNDKFKVEDKTAEQYIIVQPKFNHICEYTHKECWLQTKEYAKQHWHLIDDPNS